MFLWLIFFAYLNSNFWKLYHFAFYIYASNVWIDFCAFLCNPLCVQVSPGPNCVAVRIGTWRTDANSDTLATMITDIKKLAGLLVNLEIG